ncbi:hypothetical protein FRC17_005024 [Serendipita sp. 399]|nr:hypothetical protein FRC17_005024 [Serendipita sp. 399]
MATIASPTRRTLADVTNTPKLPANNNRKRSRRHTEEDDALLDLHECPKKTVTMEKSTSSNLGSGKTISVSVSPRLCSRRLGQGSRAYLSVLSARRCYALPVLESFVSSQTTDVHHFRNEDGETDIAVSCAYSNASNRRKESLLAVALERGRVEVVDTSKRDSWDITPSKMSVQAHDSPIFDIQWSRDDKIIAAACEASLGLIDVATETLTSRFDGHTASIKSLCWDPIDAAIIASAGRDGNIYIWDTRLHSGAYDAKVCPVMTIKQAHNPTLRRKRNVPHSTSRSVTSILYAPNSSQQLISSGSADGILLKWDLRAAKAAMEETPVDPTVAYTKSRRPRGITSIALGSNDSLIYGLGVDGMVYPYLTSTLYAHPSAFHSTGPRKFTEESESQSSTSSPPIESQTQPRQSLSFECKLSTSPCGRWLATGGTCGNAYLYDISSMADLVVDRKPVTLKGHARNVNAINWASSEMLVTCSGDHTVRVWRSDAEQARRCREESDAEWHWRWATAS